MWKKNDKEKKNEWKQKKYERKSTTNRFYG